MHRHQLSAELISLFARDHAHCLWRNTVANAAENAVEEEILCSEELFTTVQLEKDYDTAATPYFCVHSSC